VSGRADVGELFGGETADADEVLGFERVEHGAEVGAAGRVDGGAFGGGEFVLGEVGAAFAHPYERAIVEHEMLGEKVFRGAEARGEESPEAAAADLAARAGEAGDRALRMLGE